MLRITTKRITNTHFNSDILKSINLFRVLFFLGLTLITTCGAIAQVSIAPTSIFLDERLPFANLLVSNGSDTPQEISISFRFGYSDNDDEGNVVMYYDSTANTASLTDNVNAFPRNFVLPPGERQTVRITATGIGDRPDGTYWTRASVLASPLSQAVEALSDGAVAARININFEQIIPLFYKKGEVTTGLRVNDVTFEENGDEGRFLFDLSREGNSPFLGNLTLRVMDQNGQSVIEQSANLTAYYDILRGVTVDISDMEPGDYSAEFLIQSQRRDISNSDIIQITPIQQTKSITIE